MSPLLLTDISNSDRFELSKKKKKRESGRFPTSPSTALGYSSSVSSAYPEFDVPITFCKRNKVLSHKVSNSKFISCHSPTYHAFAYLMKM